MLPINFIKKPVSKRFTNSSLRVFLFNFIIFEPDKYRQKGTIMLNTITVMGRIVRDPELKHTQNNTSVVSFTIAVDRDRTGKDDERETDFIDCVAWRSTADFISKYFRKGTMTAVNGRLQIRDWMDKDGNKRRSAEVVVENIYFCESRRDSGDSGNYRTAPSQEPEDTGFNYDDIPD